MISYDDPSIMSLTEKLDPAVGQIPYNQLALTFLEINEGSDEPLDLDALDYRKYFHLRLLHRELLFDSGSLEKKDSYYEYSRCTEEQYVKSKFSSYYYTHFAKDRF